MIETIGLFGVLIFRLISVVVLFPSIIGEWLADRSKSCEADDFWMISSIALNVLYVAAIWVLVFHFFGISFVLVGES